MFAITIRPPWSAIIAETATLTAIGIAPKTVENRSRAIPDRHVGADIAIHAGATWCPIGLTDPRVRRAWAYFGNAIDLYEPNPLLAAIGDLRTGVVGRLGPGLWIDEGAVVAVATLVDCHQARDTDPTCCQPYGERTYNGKPAWHLEFAHVRRLRKRVPAKGKQPVPWNLPDDVADQVTAQLEDEQP